MDNERFCHVLHDYKDTVYRVALNYLKNSHNAEDVCQEVFLRLYRTSTPPKEPDHITRSIHTYFSLPLAMQ